MQTYGSEQVVSRTGGARITKENGIADVLLTKSGLPTLGNALHKVDGGDLLPRFRSAVVNGKRLTITFNTSLDEDVVPAPAAFWVTVGASSPAHPAEVEVDGDTAILTLVSPVTDSDAVKVRCAKPSANALRTLRGLVAGSFDDQNVTNETPSAPPAISSVAVTSVPLLDTDDDGTPDTYGQGETIFVDVEFDQPVAVDDSGAAGNVFVWLDMAPNSALRLDTNRRALPFHGLGRGGRIMRFQYTVQAADRDADGVFVQPDPYNDTVVFLKGGATVQSSTTDAAAELTLAGLAVGGDPRHKVDGSKQGGVTAPAFVRAAVNGAVLTIWFNETLDASSEPSGDAFTVSGGRAGSGTATVSGATVTVTLDSAVDPGETVTVSYAPPHGDPLQGAAGKAVTGFSGRRVTNLTARREAVADAGDDMSVEPGARVTLDGSASRDLNDDRLTFAWTQTDGPTAEVSGSHSARLSFTAPEAAGALTFRLTVTNTDELSDADEVTVTVRDLETGQAGRERDRAGELV